MAAEGGTAGRATRQRPRRRPSSYGEERGGQVLRRVRGDGGGATVPVRGTKQRALLALLALHRGKPAGVDQLIDALWEDGQSANPANALQAQIGQLRRTLGGAAILTTDAGYALAVDPDDVDAFRFEQLVFKGRRLLEEGDVEQAATMLGQALRVAQGRTAGRVRLRRLRRCRAGASGRVDSGGVRGQGRSGPRPGPPRGARR